MEFKPTLNLSVEAFAPATDLGHDEFTHVEEPHPDPQLKEPEPLQKTESVQTEPIYMEPVCVPGPLGMQPDVLDLAKAMGGAFLAGALTGVLLCYAFSREEVSEL